LSSSQHFKELLVGAKIMKNVGNSIIWKPI